MEAGPRDSSAELELSYVLPLRWQQDRGLDELTGYLRRLSAWAEVIVVDGSPPKRFAAHAARWQGLLRQMPPDADLRFAYGKVNGVTTGVRAASHEAVVIADDDVRYDAEGLARVCWLLEQADLVRPQNYFDPVPWHARWDTGRTLLNRALFGDYPGTLGVRRSCFLAMGGYDGDLIFENLELMRTVEAAGGTLASPLDLFVRRLPPDARHFLSQRVRQAYDDFALPARMAFSLSILPALTALLARRRHGAVAAAAGASVLVAEAGRRRAGGRRVFPASGSLFAPLWLLERATCSWLALGNRLVRGGQPYAGTVMRRSATPKRELRRRLAHRPIRDRPRP